MMFSLVLSLFTAVPSHALSCKEVDDKEGYHEFFQETQADSPKVGTKYHEQLVRKSVAAFYPESYSKEMTLEEVDQLGEEVSTFVVKGKDGVEYQAVNVGFGGGNSAVYLYEQKTLNFMPVYFQDGDCDEQGNSNNFPIEKEVTDSQLATVKCTTEDAKSPITSIKVDLPLTKEGVAYTSESKVTYAIREGFLEKLPASTKKYTDKQTGFPLHKKDSRYFGWSVRTTFKHTAVKPSWHVQFSVRKASRQNTVKVSGRAYENKTGGYWAPSAFDIKAEMTCDSELPIVDVKYFRVIEY